MAEDRPSIYAPRARSTGESSSGSLHELDEIETLFGVEHYLYKEYLHHPEVSHEKFRDFLKKKYLKERARASYNHTADSGYNHLVRREQHEIGQ